MNAPYPPKQAADLLSISVSTLRRVADEFAAHLPDYQPVAGERRTFTDADLRTVYAILSRLQASPAQTRSELLQELSTPDSEPLIIPAILPTANPQEARREPEPDRVISEAIASPQNALQPFLQAQADTQRQIEKFSAQLAEIQARPAQERPQNAPASRQEWRFAIATMACFGLLLAGVLVSVLLQSSQAALITSVLSLLVIAAALAWPSMRR